MALKAFRTLTCAGIIALASTTSSATSPTLSPPISRATYPLVFDRVPASNDQELDDELTRFREQNGYR